jgi:hypothetical protein
LHAGSRIQVQKNSIPENFLPRSFVGRLGLGLLSSAATAFAGVFLYALITGPFGRTWIERFIRLGMGELFAAIFAVGMCGLIWSVATPEWLPELAWRFARRLVILGLIPVIVLGAMAVMSL